MSDIKNKFNSAKDKIIGKTIEAVGKATGSEETELKGKIQSRKGDLTEKLGDAKGRLVKKINDALDKNKEEENK